MASCQQTITTYQCFLSNYFVDKSTTSSVPNVLRQLCKYLTQQWYMSPMDPAAVFDPQLDFLDFPSLITSGIASQPTPPTAYVRKVISLLTGYYGQLADSASQALSKSLDTIFTMENLTDYIKYPCMSQVNQDSTTITLYYMVENAQKADFQSNVMTHLQNFYQDERGTYTLGNQDSTFLEKVVFVRAGKVDYDPITMDSVAVMFKMDVEVRMSFSVMLRAMTVHKGAFSGMSVPDYEKIATGKSVPIPQVLNGMQCTDADHWEACKCLYYVAFGAFECPGFNYYYCQFYDACKCVLSRALPESIDEKDRINNAFGLCFDINCADTSKRPSNCQSQCDLAKQWLSSPNWAVNFINPAAVNVDLIEKTCNFKVPQFAWKPNAYFWTWEIIAGGICMLLCVPILVAMESWAKQKFSLRFVHILAFLCLVAMAIVFGYALAGVQVCAEIGEPNQATCLDRLTQSLVLNHQDCDFENPMFCQCNAATNVMKPCSDLGMSTCKCQNNQLCLPGSGDDDVLEPAVPTKRLVRWQLVYFCMGLYFLLIACAGVGLYYLTNKKSTSGIWVPQVSLGKNIALHLSIYLVLFGIVVVLPVVWKYLGQLDQTWQVDQAKQTHLCADPKSQY